MAKARLEGCIALVTGGSRGVGKGVAIGLAEAGATIIVTARTQTSGASEWPGSLEETIAAIDKAGEKELAYPATTPTMTQSGPSSSTSSAIIAALMSW